MITSRSFYSTIGVSELDLSTQVIVTLCEAAAKHMEACRYFVVFKPVGDGKTEVQDGDYLVVATLDIELPKTIWAAPSGMEDPYAITLYLPEEH